MESALYLIRFDDISPTMNWTIWDRIENILSRHGILPMLAVVPDNSDPKLVFDDPNPDFWHRVRGWQTQGYAIGLHGYQHRYVNRNAGLMRLTHQSEFAGLPEAEQEQKLRAASDIFSGNRVNIDVWIAPSHSFDVSTVKVLRRLEVRTISDGLWRWPFTDVHGTTWVPQQLWAFKPRPPGVWTVCLHHNTWSDSDLYTFEKAVAAYSSRIRSLAEVLTSFRDRRNNFGDSAWAVSDWIWNHKCGPFLRSTLKSLGASRLRS